jgi:hypothetical protein
MNRRIISVILVAGLFGWSSGLLLGVHLHHAEQGHAADHNFVEGSHGHDRNSHDDAPDGHDSSHCQICLVLHAGCKAVLAEAASALTGEFVCWPALIEPDSIAAVRQAHGSYSSRAPPGR